MRGFVATVDFARAQAVSLDGPAPVRSADGSIRLTADVRLDERRELAGRLRGCGISLHENPGDAELLLAAYLCWDVDCPRHLTGDFAFVIWDARRRQLLGACDPLGVKPLCYARTGSSLCAASEAQQVLRHSGMHVKLDEVAAGDFLLENTFEPQRTFFNGVLRLPPGHRLVARLEGERIERIWALDSDTRIVHSRDEDYAAHFLDLFRQSVRDRLRTEDGQPGAAGILMSGGLDSCSVATVADGVSRALPADGSLRLFTTSFVFDELQECDERPFIQAAASGLGLESCLIAAERFPVLDSPESCRPALEGPFLAWDGCFHEALRQARSRGAKILLTGHGGDDLLSGSVLANGDRLRRGDARVILEVARHALAQRWAWRWIVYSDLVQPLLPAAANRLFQRRGRTPEPGLPDWIDAGFAHRTGLLERLHPPLSNRGAGRARQALHSHFQKTPWDRACAWYDQHAAAYGIEVRHPFLDRRLVEFLAAIPPRQLFRTGASKPLLRRAMAGLLPDLVRLRRGKTQFGAFLEQAMAQRQRTRIERLLASPLVETSGFVDGGRLRAAYRRFQEGLPIDNDFYLWHTIALEIWMREHQRPLGIDLPSVALSRSAA